MTKWTKPVYRETEATVRSKGRRCNIMVGILSGGMVLSFRLKRHKERFTLPTDWCFQQAVLAQIEHERAIKRAARKAKKGI